MPLRILQVMAGAAHGGAEMAFVDMCIAMHDAGQVVEVVTRPNDLRVPLLEKAGLIVHQLRFGGALDIITTARLKKIIRAFKPDIVQTWMSRAAQKTPAWTPGMAIPPYLVVSRLGGYYKVGHFRQTDYFVTVTPDIKRFLLENGIAADRVAQINNFAETEPACAPADRARENTPADAVLLLALGRLHPSKAFDTLLRAMVDLPGVYLWIAGEGPLRDELHTLRSTLGLDDRVRFLGWRDDRAALLRACDVCVFPSRFEPFGTVFVQAWAQGVPVVSTASDGPRQYIRDGHDALLVGVDDIPALTAAIRRMLDDPGLRAGLVENGLARYQAEFTKDRVVAQYLDFFQAIRRREFAKTPQPVTQ
jgi:glycosyltransferase involved in cell wall biosynthesis